MAKERDNLEKLVEETETYLNDKKYVQARKAIIDLEPFDIAYVMEALPEDTIPVMFRLLPKELAAEVFVELDTDSQESLIKGFSRSELKEVIDELYLDDAVDIIEEMPANVVRRILATADPETRRSINNILQYPEDSTGSIMTTEYVDIKRTMTVEDALKRIRRIGQDMETINVMYIVDADRHLLGFLTIRDLLLAEADQTMEEIMDSNIIAAQTLDDQEETARKFEKYDFLTMPVVDKENRLVGIVTVDDALDVIVEETTEDIERMAAVIPSYKPYLNTGIVETVRSRIPWLLLLMISATFTGQIISSFEDALASQAILTAYIPMLMDTGGNSGSQASVSI
ncbi:MAG: magnesium transporter, partial [Erysipelotrichaceae bacterium]|nr:magnesium transporter [Erysipelotrichaceae bacterium]